MSERVSPIAVSEDDPVLWMPCVGVSRLAAIRFGAEELYESPWRCKARRRYIRDATKEQDCPAWPHGLDEHEEPPEDCLCGQVEDGWFFQCAADAPGAKPCWRVELRPRRIRALKSRIARATIYRGQKYGRRGPVLWGGRVERRATRLDRWLGCSQVVLLGDNWLRPEPLEWIYCDVCECRTPRHVNGRGRRRCLADSHFEREWEQWERRRAVGPSKAAPEATDVQRRTV